jgi:basic membrane protein A
MKKLIAILLVPVLVFAFAACGQENKNQSQDEKKACFITAYPSGNEFIDNIWDGFLKLEAEGWTVKMIEALDAADYEETLRGVAAEGYGLIMIFGGELRNKAIDLAEELKDAYPALYFIALDSAVDQGSDVMTSVNVDVFETSFVAGYVAALTTETKSVGCILHSDPPLMLRFSDGWDAGVAYADNGTKSVTSVTGSPEDVTLAREATLTMIDAYNVDIVYQVVYTASIGGITAGAERGIKTVGNSGWQGYLDESVFWSSLKPMDNAVYGVAQQYLAGENLPRRLNFGTAQGNAIYDERDFVKLPAELQTKILALVEGIKNGAIDVYANNPDARLDF